MPSPARSTAEMWTNTSGPPPSGWMKPKPFCALNHFTVPMAKSRLLHVGGSGASPRGVNPEVANALDREDRSGASAWKIAGAVFNNGAVIATDLSERDYFRTEPMTGA